jgi:hypothetical protein
MSEKQCPHYVDSHSCYWCIFKNTENCPKQEQSEMMRWQNGNNIEVC